MPTDLLIQHLLLIYQLLDYRFPLVQLFLHQSLNLNILLLQHTNLHLILLYIPVALLVSLIVLFKNAPTHSVLLILIFPVFLGQRIIILLGFLDLILLIFNRLLKNCDLTTDFGELLMMDFLEFSALLLKSIDMVVEFYVMRFVVVCFLLKSMDCISIFGSLFVLLLQLCMAPIKLTGNLLQLLRKFSIIFLHLRKLLILSNIPKIN